MNPHCLRAFWRVVEETPTFYLLEDKDERLVNTLSKRLSEVTSYSGDDAESISSIIRSKVPLIRDLASHRYRGPANH